MALTRRQKEILDFIEGFLDTRGYSPSFEEIAAFFQYRSLATVHEHLSNLEAKGYIRKSYNESRSIELARTEMRLAAVDLPLLGTVAAGEPIEAVADEEAIADGLREAVLVDPEAFSGETRDVVSGPVAHYVLRVRGDSMIEEQIRDGDYVIVRARDTANNGEMIIALIDGENATVKKFYREAGGAVRLQPANPLLDPMYYRASSSGSSGSTSDMSQAGRAAPPRPESVTDGGHRLPREPFLVGCRTRGTSTMWFLRPTPPPVPGPWDVAVLLREA